MRGDPPFDFRLVLAILALIVLAAGTGVAQQYAQHYSVLHSFGAGSDGVNPYGGLIMDSNGNLYGVTEIGGIHGSGTVFELSPKDGWWTERVIHSFGNGYDAKVPEAPLSMDRSGNLYGTTIYGGTHSCFEGMYTCGAVFELSPMEGGGWTEKVLHNFNNNGSDGHDPQAGFLIDAAGNLYGTTAHGGIHCYDGDEGCGTAFEMSPREGGGWTETVLHNFGRPSDGYYPCAGLVMDAAGNLYGTTSWGGIHGETSGTIFELSPREGGAWAETVLHNFGNGHDGTLPHAGLIFDAAGNLYGTTYLGGLYGDGTVFELSPLQGGGWTESVLHSFGSGTDGMEPLGSLILDSSGNLYGTTAYGGAHNGGIIFELSPQQGGGWSESILHHFGKDADGVNPSGSLISDSSGNLYGTTQSGGIHNGGTIFLVTP